MYGILQYNLIKGQAISTYHNVQNTYIFYWKHTKSVSYYKPVLYIYADYQDRIIAFVVLMSILRHCLACQTYNWDNLVYVSCKYSYWQCDWHALCTVVFGSHPELKYLISVKFNFDIKTTSMTLSALVYLIWWYFLFTKLKEHFGLFPSQIKHSQLVSLTVGQ